MTRRFYSQQKLKWQLLFVGSLFSLFSPSALFAEEEVQPSDPGISDPYQGTSELQPRQQTPDTKKRHYLTRNEQEHRVDAGVFHVAFAVGGNFYVEPQVNATTKAPLGDYFKDFGFQGGVYFDYDYSELDENIPLALRGMIGYKYILSSVHVFTFDGVVRRMFRLSEYSAFGVGIGGSTAMWYRSVTSTSPDEEMIFLPSFIIGAGFEFNPFMVDFKWLINRFGADSTITGLELYFGIRL